MGKKTCAFICLSVHSFAHPWCLRALPFSQCMQELHSADTNQLILCVAPLSAACGEGNGVHRCRVFRLRSDYAYAQAMLRHGSIFVVMLDREDCPKQFRPCKAKIIPNGSDPFACGDVGGPARKKRNGTCNDCLVRIKFGLASTEPLPVTRKHTEGAAVNGVGDATSRLQNMGVQALPAGCWATEPDTRGKGERASANAPFCVHADHLGVQKDAQQATWRSGWVLAWDGHGLGCGTVSRST